MGNSYFFSLRKINMLTHIGQGDLCNEKTPEGHPPRGFKMRLITTGLEGEGQFVSYEIVVINLGS
jgi:hypothetical protein